MELRYTLAALEKVKNCDDISYRQEKNGRLMKKCSIWLKLEFKRAAARLPVIFTEAVILAVAAGMIAFCSQKLEEARKAGGEAQATVVVVSQEEYLTGFAVSFVQEMEALKGWCRLVTADRETGSRMLMQGEAVAMIVLPERMVEGILDGTNVPAVLYLAEEMPGAAMLVQELAAAGVSVLSTAQAEIYAVHSLYERYGLEDGLGEMYGDINRYNLSLALNRGRLFRTANISASGSRTMAVYYGGAAAAVYVLLMGMALGEYPQKPSARVSLLRQHGIGLACQAAGQWMVICTLLAAGSLLLFAAAALLGPGMGFGMPSPAGIAAVTASILCSGALLQLIYTLMANRRHVIICIGAGTAVMGYICGCFLPDLLLPGRVRQLAAYLPLTYIREAWSGFFQGRTENMWSYTGILALFTAACFLFNTIWLKVKER